jgi:hypothetical protein
MRIKTLLPSWQKALSTFRFASEILTKVPRKEDSVFEILVKALAIFDSVHKHYGTGNARSNRLREITTERQLQRRQGQVFVKLFFGTSLGRAYPLERTHIDEHLDLMEIASSDGEVVLFQEENWGDGPRVTGDLYHSQGFDFAKAVDSLWGEYTEGIYLSMVKQGWREEMTFTPIPARIPGYVSPKSVVMLKELIDGHRPLVEAGESISYLFLGPKGTGKTLATSRLAAEFGGKCLNIDAAVLPRLAIDELGFLLDTLRPNFLIIDDFDRAPVEDTNARILFMAEYVKRAHPKTTLIVTANDASKIDSAMLKPDRLDEPVFFPPPDAEERREIFLGLLAWYDMKIENDVLDRLVEATDQLTHTYLAYIVRRLRHIQPARVLESVNRMRLLSVKEVATPKDPGSPPPDPKNIPRPTWLV